MKSSVNGHPSLLLDFGKELQGGLQLVTGMPGSQKPVNIRIRFGESRERSHEYYRLYVGLPTIMLCAILPYLLPWLGVAEVGNTGFRFVRIDLLDPASELQLKEVRAIFTARDIPYKGSFSCNDEQLNKIWPYRCLYGAPQHAGISVGTVLSATVWYGWADMHSGGDDYQHGFWVQ